MNSGKFLLQRNRLHHRCHQLRYYIINYLIFHSILREADMTNRGPGCAKVRARLTLFDDFMKPCSLLAAVAPVVAVAFGGTAATALAQNYPVKPVRMIVHFPPGGPTDIVARNVAQKLTDAWGYQFVIDNRPSAGGIVGVELVARAVADGYTLLFGTGGSMAITPALDKKLPYTMNDFAPISLVVINPQILVFHPSFPPNSIKELIAYAKARPGTVNYASVGPGSPQHLGVELLKSMTGIDLVHIPYKGTAPRDDRCIGGADSDDVQQHANRAAKHQSRQAQRYRGGQRQTLAGHARRAHGC